MNWKDLLTKQNMQRLLLCIICLTLIVILYTCCKGKKDIETASLIVLEKPVGEKPEIKKPATTKKRILELVGAEVNEYGHTNLFLKNNGPSCSNLKIIFESNGPGDKKTTTSREDVALKQGEIKRIWLSADEFNRNALTCKITVQSQNGAGSSKEFKFEWR